MAFFDATWYLNSVGYAAVAARPQNTAVVAGQTVRQFTTPSVGNERCFICIVAGTTANVTDATWTLTRGGKTADNTATWQECTGASAINGDQTNTPTWAAVKAISSAVTLGVIIQRNSGASYQICSIGGNIGASEPAFSNTAGSAIADGTATWTSLGPVSNFTGGQAPHARLANALTTTWFAAGNTVYVGDNHAESQTTAITISPNLSATGHLFSKILCHNHSGSYPPAAGDLTTGATISLTTAADITLSSSGGGSIYFYGLTFKAGSGSTFSGIALSFSSCWVHFDNCSFQLNTTSASAAIYFGSAGVSTTTYILNNTTVKFGNAVQSISPRMGNFIWQNTGQILAAGSTVPTTLFILIANAFFNVMVLEALDLSQLTGAIFNPNNLYVAGTILIKDCKLNASVTVGVPTTYGETIQLVGSDPTVAYKSARYTYEGTETTETAIVRTGGAVDPTGQAQSRKIVTTANAQWLRPFKAEPYAVWNSTTGANVTVTVCGTVNSGALPNNDDIWLEVEYFGDAGTVSTSYSNPGGQGDRTASITISTTATAGGGVVTALIDGSSANGYYWTTGQTTREVVFDFGVGASKVIDEFTWEQSAASQHGDWKFEGSNDGSSYTTFPENIDLGNTSATRAFPVTNSTGYRYYRLRQIANVTTSGPYLREITFKIGNVAAASPLGKIVNTTKSNLLASNAAVASDSSTWNGTQYAGFDDTVGTSSQVTVSNNNLTATINSAANPIGARSLSLLTTGKYYFEVTVGATLATNHGIGIITSAGTYANMNTGTNSVVVVQTGLIYSNNSSTLKNIGTLAAGDVICFAVDLTARLAWVRRNSGNWNNDGAANPATGTGGVTVVAASSFSPAVEFGSGGVVGNSFTGNFGLSTYAQSAPSGFGNWPGSTWTPFKLTKTLSSPQPGLPGYIHARVRVGKASATYYLDPQITLS